jgi:hypothetical protein
METETRFMNNAQRINHADQNQNQNLPVNEENDNQIPKPKRAAARRPAPGFTHRTKKILGDTLTADLLSCKKKIARLLRDQNQLEK